MLIVQRQTRRSRDHLCVSDGSGRSIGHYDFKADHAVAKTTEDKHLIEAVVAGWRAREAVDASTPLSQPENTRGGLLPKQWRRRAAEARAPAPTTFGTVPSGPARTRTVSEEIVTHLNLLVHKDARWCVFHNLDNPDEGLQADHLVLGPLGVFLVVPLDLAGAKVVIDGDDLTVDGEPQDDIVAARASAVRVGRALGLTNHFGIDVIPVLTPVGHAELEIDAPPTGVFVVPRGNLIRWMRSRDQQLSDDTLDVLVEMISELAGGVLQERLPTG